MLHLTKRKVIIMICDEIAKLSEMQIYELREELKNIKLSEKILSLLNKPKRSIVENCILYREVYPYMSGFPPLHDAFNPYPTELFYELSRWFDAEREHDDKNSLEKARKQIESKLSERFSSSDAWLIEFFFNRIVGNDVPSNKKVWKTYCSVCRYELEQKQLTPYNKGAICQKCSEKFYLKYKPGLQLKFTCDFCKALLSEQKEVIRGQFAYCSENCKQQHESQVKLQLDQEKKRLEREERVKEYHRKYDCFDLTQINPKIKKIQLEQHDKKILDQYYRGWVKDQNAESLINFFSYGKSFIEDKETLNYFEVIEDQYHSFIHAKESYDLEKPLLDLKLDTKEKDLDHLRELHSNYHKHKRQFEENARKVLGVTNNVIKQLGYKKRTLDLEEDSESEDVTKEVQA